MKLRQKRRQEHLLRSCAALEFQDSPEPRHNLSRAQLSGLQHTFVIDHPRLLYCYIPKVSCTNWKRLFLVSKGYFPSVDVIKNAHVEAQRAFRTLSQLSTKKANLKLRSHPHFMFVRNPFSRLLSAFREKIENRDPTKCYFSKYMTRWFAKTNPSYLVNRSPSSPYNFTEFVRYAISRRVDNEHWNDQYQLCSPCLVKYDFIGKYETLMEDAEYFLRTVVNDSSLSFPAPQKRPTHSSDDEIMEFYYRQISDRDLSALTKCLYTDMRLFGYAIPDSVKRVRIHSSAKHLRLIDIG
ncbi:carbohydrate sulfotransferase 11-like [Diadema setosum]|uniref:carbohydrate sulfotransferase 11-like n=1 Tax=Diadema setosum TaxID=31175 RepID=UPI003B3A353F